MTRSPSGTGASSSPDGSTPAEILRSLWRYQFVGLLAVTLMFGGVGGWAAMTTISGAVIAPGSVVVEGNSKKVQHLEGGIVAAVSVRSADRVEAGQVLLRLDDTEVRASLQIIRSQLLELRARRARLLAERDGAATMELPPGLGAASVDPQHVAIWRDQANLFASRRAGRGDKENQQHERIAQLQKVIEGSQAQLQGKSKQIGYLKDELAGLVELQEQQLVAKPKVLLQQRELSKLEGEHGQIVADIARHRVQISETRLQIAEARQAFASEVLGEFRDVETKLAELTEREEAAAAKLRRLTVLAPISGIVHKLSVFNPGGVVGAGEALMEIVPAQTTLVVEGQLDPSNIDQIKPSQPVMIRLTALDQRVTPELEGRLISVSADVRQDAPQLPRYYAVRAAVQEHELGKLGASRLVPGMPAEVMILRGDRTVLGYLVKPLLDQVAHAFRER
jgi:HlyD family secretion protein